MTNYRRKRMALRAQAYRPFGTLGSAKSVCSLMEAPLIVGLIAAAILAATMM